MKGLYCTLRSCALAMPLRHIKSASIKVHLLFNIPFIIFVQSLCEHFLLKTQKYAFYCIQSLLSCRKCFDKAPSQLFHKYKMTILSKFFAFFEDINRLKVSTRSVGRKYAILSGSKITVLGSKMQKVKAFLCFSSKKVSDFARKQGGDNLKKSRLCENFATARENYLRPFFKKTLTFSHQV